MVQAAALRPTFPAQLAHHFTENASQDEDAVEGCGTRLLPTPRIQANFDRCLP